MPSESLAEEIGRVPHCDTCGSENVVRDALVYFNPEYGLYEVETVLDNAYCKACDRETKLAWAAQEIPPNQRIRELNDRFRREGRGNGSVMVTSGVQAHGGAFTVEAVKAVRNFEGFSDDNDPWGEHDFGVIEIEGQKVFFKIDYLDPVLTKGSENPANERCTHRVLTIMLAEEY